jgi:hypothetical protein
MIKNMVRQYVPNIEDDIAIPADPVPTYSKKIRSGEMIRIAQIIRPGQSVVLPSGSVTKFRKLIWSRGFDTVMRGMPGGEPEMRVWVIKASPDT